LQTSRDSAPLVRAPIMAVMLEDHPLASHDRINLALLAQQQLIMMPRNSLLRRWIDGRFAEIGLAPAPRIEASTMASGCILAAKGLGVTIADAFTIETAGIEGLVVRPLDPPLDATFGYVLPTQRQPSPLILRFLELVRQSAEEVLANPTLLKGLPRARKRARHAKK
jgi:DNA-binding transcriptional LysR family regulator